MGFVVTFTGIVIKNSLIKRFSRARSLDSIIRKTYSIKIYFAKTTSKTSKKRYTCACENGNCFHVYFRFNKVTGNFTKMDSITNVCYFFHYFRNRSFQVHVQITTSSIACLWSCLTRVSLSSCNKYQIKESKVELLIKPITRNVDWQIKFEQNKWYIAN